MSEQQINEEKKAFIEEQSHIKVKWKGYVYLLFAIIFFGGFFAGAHSWLKIFDFTTILGKFGVELRGTTGAGARDGFMFGFTVFPSVALCLGIINVVEGQQGLLAAQKLLNPIFKPLCGFPGWCGLAAVTGLLTSTDGGAALTRDIVDKGFISKKEQTIFTCFQYTASCGIGAPLSLGALWYPLLLSSSVIIIYPFLLVIVVKIIGANLMRLYCKYISKEFKEVNA